MNNIEKKWATYFDKLGYDYLHKPEQFYLQGGWNYTPNFYLIDFGVICHVSKGMMRTKTIHCFTTCCMQYQLKGLCLDSPKPSLKYYEMVIPGPLPDQSHLSESEKLLTNPKSTYKTRDVNVVEDPNKEGHLMESYYLTEEEEYREYRLEQVI